MEVVYEATLEQKHTKIQDTYRYNHHTSSFRPKHLKKNKTTKNKKKKKKKKQ